MDAAELRAMQAPIKDRYKTDAKAAFITLKAKGTLDDSHIACKVETGRALAVATAFRVTPAQATSASSSMSPEQSSMPEPPVAGCRPATASARPVSTLQAMLVSSSEPFAFKVMNAALASLLYFSLIGACIARKPAASIVILLAKFR